MTTPKDLVELRVHLWLARANRLELHLQQAYERRDAACRDIVRLEAERDDMYATLSATKKELDAQSGNVGQA